MIISFGCKHTEKIWKGEHSNQWSNQIVNIALRKLFMVNAANNIKDLMIPPSNRLHKLQGDMSEYWSISVNMQWRIIFKWEEGDASDVQLVDYH